MEGRIKIHTKTNMVFLNHRYIVGTVPNGSSDGALWQVLDQLDHLLKERSVYN